MDSVTAPQPLCRLGDIPDGGATAIDAKLSENDDETSSLILLRRDGIVQAYRNVCPHAGRRLDYAPGQFLLKHGGLICAVHGASFNQDDGLCIAGPCRGEHLTPVPVRIEAEVVYLGPAHLD